MVHEQHWRSLLHTVNPSLLKLHEYPYHVPTSSCRAWDAVRIQPGVFFGGGYFCFSPAFRYRAKRLSISSSKA